MVVSARTDAAELKRRIDALRALNEMTAERDNAIVQRDQARRDNRDLQTQLRIVTNERDEARALGRCA